MNTIDAKKFYNEVMPEKQGSDYEQARWHHNAVAHVGYEQTRISIAASLPKDASIATILEIGPGAGTWTKLLIERYPAAALTLLDISREMLERSRTALGDRPVTYVESAFGDYSAAPFDFLFSSRMLEYMEDKGQFSAQVARLLKPGATAVFITKYPHYTRQRLQGKKISNFHTGQITPAALSDYFTQQGLAVTMVKPVTVSVPFFKSATLNRLVGVVVRALPLTFLTAPFVESYLIKVIKRHDS